MAKGELKRQAEGSLEKRTAVEAVGSFGSGRRGNVKHLRSAEEAEIMELPNTKGW
jgi:hypothetical protein